MSMTASLVNQVSSVPSTPPKSTPSVLKKKVAMNAPLVTTVREVPQMVQSRSAQLALIEERLVVSQSKTVTFALTTVLRAEREAKFVFSAVADPKLLKIDQLATVSELSAHGKSLPMNAFARLATLPLLSQSSSKPQLKIWTANPEWSPSAQKASLSTKKTNAYRRIFARHHSTAMVRVASMILS